MLSSRQWNLRREAGGPIQAAVHFARLCRQESEGLSLVLHQLREPTSRGREVLHELWQARSDARAVISAGTEAIDCADWARRMEGRGANSGGNFSGRVLLAVGILLSQQRCLWAVRNSPTTGVPRNLLWLRTSDGTDNYDSRSPTGASIGRPMACSFCRHRSYRVHLLGPAGSNGREGGHWSRKRCGTFGP